MKITPEMNEQIVEGAYWRWKNYGYFGDINDSEALENDACDVDREYIKFMEDIEVIYWEEEEDKDQHWGSAMSILLYGKDLTKEE